MACLLQRNLCCEWQFVTLRVRYLAQSCSWFGFVPAKMWLSHVVGVIASHVTLLGPMFGVALALLPGSVLPLVLLLGC